MKSHTLGKSCLFHSHIPASRIPFGSFPLRVKFNNWLGCLKDPKIVWQNDFSPWEAILALGSQHSWPSSPTSILPHRPASSPFGLDKDQLPGKFKPTMAKTTTAANWLNVSDQLSVPRSFP